LACPADVRRNSGAPGGVVQGTNLGARGTGQPADASPLSNCTLPAHWRTAAVVTK